MPGWATLRGRGEADEDGFIDGDEQRGGGTDRESRRGAPGLEAQTGKASSSAELDGWDTSSFGGGAVLVPTRGSGMDDSSTTAPDRYIVSGAPPPCGQGAPKSPNEFLNLNVACARKSPDATGRNVIWYDISIRTTTHMWTITKRFSDLVQFHGNLSKLQLEKYKGDAKDERGLVPKEFPPPFPSKYHLRGNHSRALIEERRAALDKYVKEVLRYLQALTLSAIGCNKAYHAPLRAGFALIVDCLRSSSQSELGELNTGPWAKEDPYSPTTRSSGSPSGSPSSPQRPHSSMRRSSFFPSPLRNGSLSSSPGGGETDYQPPCKIVLEAYQRFTIMFLLPGVLLSDIYVDSTSDRNRKVIIGGKWNQRIVGIESLRSSEQLDDNGSVCGTGRGGKTSREASGSNSPPLLSNRSGCASSAETTARRGKRSILMDTFPRGSFEMIFEIPAPFEPAHWYSEYEGGVLMIMWNAPSL